MALMVEAEPLPLAADVNGVLRVSGTRVTLDTVVGAFNAGALAEEIVLRYDSLQLADVDLDLVRVQDVGLSGAADPDVLQWAAEQGRVLLTHDFDTLIGEAWTRVRVGLPMPGVVAVRQSMATGQAIDGLELFAAASEEGE